MQRERGVVLVQRPVGLHQRLGGAAAVAGVVSVVHSRARVDPAAQHHQELGEETGVHVAAHLHSNFAITNRYIAGN